MKRFLIIIAVLTVLVPGALLAQDEITLEGLAEQLAEVVEQVADLAERVATIEEIWTGPGSRELTDVACIIGENTILQDESVLKYKDQYEEWVNVEEVTIKGVVYNKETGYIVITYADTPWGFDDKRVAESWDGCEFVISSDWWEME